MFVDKAVVTFIAGDGGNGCVSFRREKFVPRGGPNGGDGGRGGHIILCSRSAKNSLVDFKFRNIIKSEKGEHGKGSNRFGKNGADEILSLPAGTVVKTYPEEKVIFDFDRENMEFVIAKGGKGGRGNAHFKSSVRQAPRIAERGGKGESIKVILELKLIAFAGIVGLPNAGKSTLISKISAAKPKIADYPFTTLTPHLGVIYSNDDSLVVADIPGIIEGAHQGEGMGLDFLKHIERNEVLIFLIDISLNQPSSPLEVLFMLRNELKSYKPALLAKKFLVVGNKADLIAGECRETADGLRAYCRQNKIAYLEISALKGLNLNQFKKKLFEYYHEK
jgi:GTP-binding protein